MIPDWVPVASYALIASSAIPAIYKMHKRKSSKDVSVIWQSMIFVGVSIIFLYAITANSIWAIGGIFNIVSSLSVLLVVLYYKYKGTDK